MEKRGEILSYARVLWSIHLFSLLLEEGQFQIYLTAQEQNDVPSIFAFLTYQTYQNSNALFNLRLLLVLGWVLMYGNWSIEDDQMQTRISSALRAVTEEQIKITKTKLPLAFNFQNVIPTLAFMKSCKIRKFILLENTRYSFIASSISFN